MQKSRATEQLQWIYDWMGKQIMKLMSLSAEKLTAHPQIVLSNAPCSAESTIVITQTRSKGLHWLAQYFNIRGERLLENMRLMIAGEALLFDDTDLDTAKPILTS